MPAPMPLVRSGAVPVVDYAFNAFAQMHHVEIQKQTERLVGQLKVGEELSFVDRQQGLDALEFDDDHLFYEKIDPVSGFELQAIILHRDRYLCLNMQTRFSQFVMQTGLIHAFQNSGSNRRMNLKRSSQNSRRNLVQIHLLFRPPHAYLQDHVKLNDPQTE